MATNANTARGALAALRLNRGELDPKRLAALLAQAAAAAKP